MYSRTVSFGDVRGSLEETRILEKGEQKRIVGKDSTLTTSADKEKLLFATGSTEHGTRKAEIRRLEVRTDGVTRPDWRTVCSDAE